MKLAVASRMDRSLLGRILVLLLLLGAWVNPSLPTGDSPVDIVLLLDESASFRRQDSHAAWREITGLCSGLPAGSRFSLIRFGGRSQIEVDRMDTGSPGFHRLIETSPPRSQGVDPNRSNLELALRTALTTLAPDRSTLMIMATDGQETTGMVDRLLGGELPDNAVLRWWRPESEIATDASWIRELRAPERASPGERITLAADLQGGGGGSIGLRLELDDRILLERRLNLPPGEPTTELFDLQISDPGNHLVRVTLEQPGQISAAGASRAAMIRVGGLARVLVISDQNTEAPVSSALQSGGWDVTEIGAANFHQLALADREVIVLNNLPASALSEANWQAISQAVAQQGTGLIVLGGHRSFGGGGYRHALVESLLPVVSQSRRPQQPAAVLFVLDRSGSMDQGSDQVAGGKIAIARQAIQASVALLEPGDLTGLLAFDVSSEVILPLAIHNDTAIWSSLTGAQSPKGGTLLAPALEKAMAMLSGDQDQQRLIVLITDGNVEHEADFPGIAKRLEKAGIGVIALAIGREAGASPALSLLTRPNQGRLLPVVDLAMLPRLMSDAILTRRSVLHEDSVIPQLLEPLGFRLSQTAPWPPLDSYMVTREKQQANVHLASPSGDPLFASWFFGSGRVTALPGGLGEWASAWTTWDSWGEFIGGLVEWSNSNRDDPGLHISRSPGLPILLDLDVAGEDGQWDSETPLEATVIDSSGSATTVVPRLIAPGRYRLETPVTQSGRHDIYFKSGSHSARYTLFHEPAAELDPSPKHRRAFDAALTQGDIQVWGGAASLARLAGKSTGPQSRQPLLLLALITYLATLAGERNIQIRLMGRFLSAISTAWRRAKTLFTLYFRAKPIY